VLVVEDEPDARELPFADPRVFRRRGQAVTSAQEALDNLQSLNRMYC